MFPHQPWSPWALQISQPSQGTRTLGAMEGDKGRGHQELYTKTGTKQGPFATQPHGRTSTPSSRGRCAPRGGCAWGRGMSPPWLCSMGDSHREREVGREGRCGPGSEHGPVEPK